MEAAQDAKAEKNKLLTDMIRNTPWSTSI
jgi:hypothetical protein